MTIKEAIYERHTVRKFNKEEISKEAIDSLNERIKQNNEKYGLNIELVIGNADSLPWFAKHVISKGVSNYIVLAGKQCSNLDEKLGYCGSDLILYAQTLGLNTWWDGFTYSKKGASKNISAKDATVNGIIAIGHGKSAGVQHKLKSSNKISSYEGEAPEWFIAGVDAVLHAPTAMNKMKYSIKGSGNKVSITCTNGRFAGIDLGIAKNHFEIGASIENFEWE